MIYFTGSKWEAFENGWHLRNLFTARSEPKNAPCFSIDSYAYREHVGVNRHE